MRYETVDDPADEISRMSARWSLAVLASVVLQIVLVLMHAPWRDECQALQIALQSPDLTALFVNLRYEGHPPLWFLVLRGAGAILPAAWVLPAVQSAIATTTMLLVLLRAPFSKPTRLCIALSPFLLFEYGTVARGMALGTMLLVLAFAAVPRWLRWGAIILLPLVEFQFGLLSLSLLVLAWRDRRWSWLGAGLWLAAALAAAWSVRRAADIVPAAIAHGAGLEFGRLLTVFAALLVPVQTMDGHFEWNGTLPYPFSVFAGFGFSGLSWVLLRNHRLASTLFAVSFLALIAMSVFVYPLALRHLALLPVFMILLLWRETRPGRVPDPALRLWLGLLGTCGMLSAVIGLTVPFDRARDVATFIRARALEDKTWASYPEPQAQGVSALLGLDMLAIPTGCTQSFVRWNHAVEYADEATFDTALAGTVRTFGPFYLSTDHNLKATSTVAIVPLARFAAGYDGVAYNLYRIGGIGSHRAPPSCAPPRRRLSLWPH